MGVLCAVVVNINKRMDVRGRTDSVLGWQHHTLLEKWHKAPPSHERATARLVFLRAARHVHRLHQPDAWLCPTTQVVAFQPRDEWTPLRPGDVLQYTLRQGSMSLHVFTHDALYVGRGWLADFRPAGTEEEEAAATGRVRMPVLAQRSWEGVVALRQVRVVDKNNRPYPWHVVPGINLSNGQRLARLWRCLSSLGFYGYSLRRFNCQHMVSAWVHGHAGALDSVAVARMRSIVLGTTTLSIGAAAVVVGMSNGLRNAHETV